MIIRDLASPVAAHPEPGGPNLRYGDFAPVITAVS
jgi:hypothetical protein